jgi:NADH:ubiquinone oxidoreductase subunit K
MSVLSLALQDILQFFSDDPSVLLMQLGIALAAIVVVFLVLLTTRDVLRRTDSLVLQLFSIIVVAALPILGFLLYVLFRPARTVAERKLERDLDELLRRVSPSGSPSKKLSSERKKT